MFCILFMFLYFYGQIPDKAKEEVFISVCCFEGLHCIIARKWKQPVNTTLATGSKELWMVLLLLPSVRYSSQLPFRMGLSFSVKPFWNHPHRHTQNCVSIVILNFNKLTIKISHHSMTVLKKLKIDLPYDPTFQSIYVLKHWTGFSKEDSFPCHCNRLLDRTTWGSKDLFLSLAQ